MSLAIVHSRARRGVQAPEVRVEVHLAGGLPCLSIVGLPEAAVRESKDRVRAAIQCAQLEFPARRITVNLAPADLKKHGGRFDLPIALGILAASGQLPVDSLNDVECIGELALTGELREVDGVLPAAIASSRAGRQLLLPLANAEEAALYPKARALGARTLSEALAHLSGRRRLATTTRETDAGHRDTTIPDLSDVRGQARARRALEIAAAGAHHLLLIGSPGCGKTMLASRLPGILPPATEDEAIEAAAVASVSGRGLDVSRWRQRPFRAPHHGASSVALVGGGPDPKPGEISLAHQGVLFLDELPEWHRHTLEALREPLESGQVTISRAARQAEFPARFQLVAAMNPCPCGWAGDSSGRCSCTPDQVQRYRGRLSGPLLDRIDLHVDVPRMTGHEISPDAPRGESSAVVRERVVAARERALQRCGVLNARMDQRQTEQHCRLAPDDRKLLEQAMDRLNLSARAIHRILRSARTIADLDHSDAIATGHLGEAIGYRVIDRG